ncbi:MAG: RagB/SusD family nutrient uptake outer membrane protein [Acinetobacter sp.]|nr:MAG: RagB/SusD family nutrient uptake outer membrane protein [Acinetobacter sp.]
MRIELGQGEFSTLELKEVFKLKYTIMKLRFFLFMTAMVIMLIACDKYLDVKSDARLVVPTTLKDAQGLLDDAALINLAATPSYGETSADDFFLTQATLNSVGVTGVDLYSWKSIDYRYGNDWSKAYLVVFNANLCLELLEKIDRTTSNRLEWDNAKGSALFLRSYYYLMLTAQHGLGYDENTAKDDLGIVIRQSSDFNKISLRSSIKDCFSQIVTDLEQCIKYLPDYPQHVMRPSKGAAYALLARTYLYLHRYDDALKNSNEALRLNAQLIDYNSDPDVIGITANVPFKKFNKETIFYSEMWSGFEIHGTFYAKIDTSLYDSYGPNDLRKTAFFKSNGNYQQFKGSYAANATTLFSGLATDEQYLTRAESKAYLNNVTGAMDDLNTLLKKRWKLSVPYIPITATNTIEALTKVRQERRKELIMRGLRWADIKRYNKEGSNIVLTREVNGKLYKLEPNSKSYALPLPTDIIQLSGVPQN